MREKQAPKRYEYRRKAVKDNRKYVAGIAVAIIIVAAFFLLRGNQIKEAAADQRLDAEKLVVGVIVNGTAKAYPADSFDIVNDVLGGVPILVTKDGAFERKLNDRYLEFTLVGGEIVDSNGRIWNDDGTSRYGVLNKVNSQKVPWYVWLSWHKDTEIYKGI